MDQTTNYKLKINYIITKNITSTQITRKSNSICKECNRRKISNEIYQTCHTCYKAKKTFISSGNKVIDDFIRYTLTNCHNLSGRMEYVPYDRLQDIEFIAEGGFSKIYKATWIDGPISNWNNKKQKYSHWGPMMVALKELNNSKNINSDELNELKIFYHFANRYQGYTSDGDLNFISKYFGITQHPITQNFMIITRYYEKGDLTNYIANNFFEIDWADKLDKLSSIIIGLRNIHNRDIIHKDYHSGNIFIDSYKAITGDLGISKSSLDNDEDNEIYGIIPYVAPEIFQGQKYTKASNIYSFGMIMWEFMTGRRPFWDQSHDAKLIIEICDGLRPPIVTNAPKGYIELMQRCWHSDPEKRPTVTDIFMLNGELQANIKENPINIIETPDIGPITKNHSNAIYKSRPLSAMIKLANSTMILRDINSGIFLKGNKRKVNDNLIEDNEDETIKKIKISENKNNGRYYGYSI